MHSAHAQKRKLGSFFFYCKFQRLTLPCSAKSERKLPEAKSSSCPAARVKTKCSRRRRTGHSCEHRIFHEANSERCRRSAEESWAPGDHFDPALQLCHVMAELSSLPSAKGNMLRAGLGARSWISFKEQEKEGESCARRAGRRGGVCFGAQSTFPGALWGERSAAGSLLLLLLLRLPPQRRNELDVNEPVVLCRDLPTNPAPSRDNVPLPLPPTDDVDHLSITSGLER